MKRHLLFCLLLTLARVGPANACRDYTHTLLNRLPAAALTEPVVAVIEVIELLPPPWPKNDRWDYTSLFRVRVAKAIQGVSEGQVFVVDTGGWMCGDRSSSKYPQFPGKRHFYIAGQFKNNSEGDVRFVGDWIRDDVNGYVKVRTIGR